MDRSDAPTAPVGAAGALTSAGPGAAARPATGDPAAWRAFLQAHAARWARDAGAYWSGLRGPESFLWQASSDRLRARRVRVVAGGDRAQPSKFTTALHGELTGLSAREAEAVFHLAAHGQCTIRDGRDLVLTGWAFLYNWEQLLRTLHDGSGNLALPGAAQGFGAEDETAALRAVCELFRAGAAALFGPPALAFRGGASWDFRCPRLLGVVNITPDSFSDGGRFLDADEAVRHAERLVAEGADALDLGAESTRPGAAPVPAREQLARLLPVLRRLRRSPALARVPVSVDTQSADAFAAAWAEGADLWNDVSALREPGALEAAARLGCPVILMHMQGTPRTMQQDPHYDDVVDEVELFFRERLRAAAAAGLRPTNVLLDPGIGFGKTVEHNCELLRRLAEFRALGRPLAVGVSRKSFLGKLTGEAVPERRVGASVAAGLLAAAHGAAILRVHDVAPHVEALQAGAAILQP